MVPARAPNPAASARKLALKRRAAHRGNSHTELTRRELDQMLAAAAYQRAAKARSDSER